MLLRATAKRRGGRYDTNLHPGRPAQSVIHLRNIRLRNQFPGNLCDVSFPPAKVIIRSVVICWTLSSDERG